MWKMLAVPLVGAIIGYFTNWIAVKMLFHPRHEIRIAGWKLPFTPGVIPKGQPRLARAIGHAVETRLLTKEVMEGILLSHEMLEHLYEAVNQYLSEKKEDPITGREAMLTLMDEESYVVMRLQLQDLGAEYIVNKLMEMNIGKKLSDKLMKIAQEKLAETMFGMMLGGSFLDSIGEMIENYINDYLTNRGQDYIERVLDGEIDRIEDKRIGEGIELLEHNGFDLAALVVQIYEIVIREHIGSMMETLNLSKVVEDRINTMKVEEVEELVLSIMKKELGTIVNLGAIIGFILGLLNLLIFII